MTRKPSAGYPAPQNLQSGRVRNFETLYKRCILIREKLARDHPSDSQNLRALALCYNNKGYAEQVKARFAEGLPWHERALAIMERLVGEEPSNLKNQIDLSWTCHLIAFTLTEMDRPDDAWPIHERALSLRERLAEENPSNVEIQSGLGFILRDMADTRRRLGRSTEALAFYHKAEVTFDRLLIQEPLASKNLVGLRSVYNSEANFHRVEGRHAEALACFRQSQTIQEKLDLLDPKISALDDRLAAVLAGTPARDDPERVQLANRASEKARYGSAVRLFAEAFANDPRLADDRATQSRYRAARAAVLASSGWSEDNPRPLDSIKPELRRQALSWLRAELASWESLIADGSEQTRRQVATGLREWKMESALYTIREDKELNQLPEEEGQAFRQLWADVDRLLVRADSHP